LEHIADALPQGDRINRTHIFTVHAHDAFRRCGESVDQPQQRRLPAPDGPTTVRNSRSGTVSETLSSTLGDPLPKAVDTASISIAPRSWFMTPK
jgi:hypothetical protein